MRPEIHDESLIPNANDRSWSAFKPGVIHVLVTGSAGYIGSHAALRLLKDSYCVTIVDNFSRRKLSAIKVLQEQFPEPGRLQFIYVDLGDVKIVNMIFSENAFDAIMYFAVVAYIGENTLEPLRHQNLHTRAKAETPSTSRLGEVVKSFVKYLNLSVGTVTGRSDLVEHGGKPRLDDNCRDDDQHGSVRSIGVGISSDAANIGSEVPENLVGGSCEEDLKYFHDYDIGLRHSQQESDKKYTDRSKRVKREQVPVILIKE
uniref:NAD(P)-binding domain-containing protein n=1 Tax=Vitis vinifera TaxID=29760 RepID=F6I2T7_VITVI